MLKILHTSNLSSSSSLCRHDIRERDSRIQKLMGDLRSVMEERDKLQQLGSHGQQLRNRLAQEAEYKIASLKVTTLHDHICHYY